MKNFAFWASLFFLTFWDEMIVIATSDKKKKSFLETGETPQNFIGAVDDEIVALLKGLFSVKRIPKQDKIYQMREYKELDTVIYEIDGGARNGRMTLQYDTTKGFYTSSGNRIYYLFIANGYEEEYEEFESKRLFGNNKVSTFVETKEDILFVIWVYYLMEWNRWKLREKVENFNQIQQIADSGNYELALILLSGVEGIKEILK